MATPLVRTAILLLVSEMRVRRGGDRRVRAINGSVDRAGVLALAATATLGGLLACVQTETDAPERVEIAGDSAATGVPLEMVGPGDAAVTVEVHVNGGGPYRFVLDTGATLTCLDSALVDRLGLEEPAGVVGRGVGIGRQAGSMRLVRIDSLRVGDASATGLTGCALDLANVQDIGLDVDGLLGLDFLEPFRVTLDFPARRLHLERD